MNQIKRTMRARAITPPMTPPAIAPTFVPELGVFGELRGPDDVDAAPDAELDSVPVPVRVASEI